MDEASSARASNLNPPPCSTTLFLLPSSLNFSDSYYNILQTTSDSEVIFRYLRVFIPSNHDIFDVDARKVVKLIEFLKSYKYVMSYYRPNGSLRTSYTRGRYFNERNS